MNKLTKTTLAVTVFSLLVVGGILAGNFREAGATIVINGVTYKTVEEALNAAVPFNKATVKGKEMAKIKTIGKIQRGDYWIEVVDMKVIEGGLEAFVKAWDKNNNQIGFGRDGTVEIERFVIINPPILVYDSEGNIVREWTDEVTGEIKQRKLKEDLREALLQSLEHTLSVKKQKYGSAYIIKGKIGNTTLTAYPQAGTGTAPIDGRMARGTVDETFSTIHNGAGQAVSNTATDQPMSVLASATTDQFSVLQRWGFGFNTSSIGSDSIDSATFSLRGTNVATQLGTTDLDIVSFSPADGSNFASSDYAIASFGGTRFATGISSASWSTTGYNDFTLNASGENNINKSGNTYFGALFKWDLDNNFTGTWGSGLVQRFEAYMADQTGTTDDPKLVVEHTYPGPTLSNLQSSEVTSTSAVISWTTDDISDSEVLYGTTTPVLNSNPLLTKIDPATTTNHNLTLTGLDSNTTYYYIASSTNGVGYSSTSTQQSFATLVGSTLFAHKPQDQATSSQAVLFVDDDLSIELNANTSYVLTAAVTASSTSITPDIQTAFEIPSGASMALTFGSFDGTQKVAGSGLFSSNTTTVSIDLPSTGLVVMQIDGVVTTGATAGFVKFKWAQNTSSVSEIKVFKGSYMRAEEI